MTGWIVAFIIAAVAGGYFIYKRRNGQGNAGHNIVREQVPAQNRTQNNGAAARPAPTGTETGSMIYFANDRHGQADKEYRFNYKKINGAWRAYILKMPDLQGRDSGSSVIHRLWDENHTPYICWGGTITSLKDMQNVSRVWADSIQEYIATGKRFGPV